MSGAWPGFPTEEEFDPDSPGFDPTWRYVPPAGTPASRPTRSRPAPQGQDDSVPSGDPQSDSGDASGAAPDPLAAQATCQELRLGLKARGWSPEEIDELVDGLDPDKFEEVDRVFRFLDALDKAGRKPVDLGQGARGSWDLPLTVNGLIRGMGHRDTVHGSGENGALR